MPNAIRQNDMTRPKQEIIAIVLNVWSAAIEEIVFMICPLSGPNGPYGDTS
jgi:hypothetical protein